MTNESLDSHVDNPAVDHESTDVNVRAILGFGAVLFVTAIVVHVVIWLLFLHFERREAQPVQAAYPLSVSQGARVPPEPRLQIAPREDLRALRGQEEQMLNSYGWVDRNAGIVRIPIAEAMRLTIERGLPTREEAAK
jgi:hypothetical protein